MERNARTEHAPFSLSPVAACIPWKAVRSRETPRWKQRRLVTELFDDSLNGIATGNQRKRTGMKNRERDGAEYL